VITLVKRKTATPMPFDKKVTKKKEVLEDIEEETEPEKVETEMPDTPDKYVETDLTEEIVKGELDTEDYEGDVEDYDDQISSVSNGNVTNSKQNVTNNSNSETSAIDIIKTELMETVNKSLEHIDPLTMVGIIDNIKFTLNLSINNA